MRACRHRIGECLPETIVDCPTIGNGGIVRRSKPQPSGIFSVPFVITDIVGIGDDRPFTIGRGGVEELRIHALIEVSIELHYCRYAR